ncbi:hypothetical protein TNCV_621321 [Trichonephila clavipes]|nr:hypothetical protein TNCV_621321 [Trichonephila clavipes]
MLIHKVICPGTESEKTYGDLRDGSLFPSNYLSRFDQWRIVASTAFVQIPLADTRIAQSDFILQVKSPPVKSGFVPQAESYKGYVLGVSQWVDKGIPSLLGNLTLVVSCQTGHLTGTSAYAPQGLRSRILNWAQ